MKLSQLIAALPDLHTQPPSDPDITLITTDSRQVIPGALFVAYPGVSVDGHHFIPQALRTRGTWRLIGRDARSTLTITSAIWPSSSPQSTTSRFAMAAKPSRGSTPRGTAFPRAS